MSGLYGCWRDGGNKAGYCEVLVVYEGILLLPIWDYIVCRCIEVSGNKYSANFNYVKYTFFDLQSIQVSYYYLESHRLQIISWR